MAQGEGVLFWAAVALYLTGSVAFLAALVFQRGAWAGWATFITLVGFLSHNGAIAFRWVATGHPPIIGDYENALAASWVIILIFLLVQYRFRGLRGLGVAVVPFCLLMLGYGVMRSPQLEPMTPPFQSNWLYIHITFAWLAYGSYAVAAGLAVLFLAKERQPHEESGGDFYHRLPSLEIVDELSYRFITFGFVADGIMLVAGAIWANSLWGSYWSWDPIQTWSLISWLIYGIYLHLRVTMGWRMKRAAWLAILSLVAVIISFWGTNYLAAGLHVF